MDADPDPDPVPVVSASHGPVRSLPSKIQRMLSDPEQELGEDEKKPEVRLLKDLKNRLQQLIDGYLLEPSEIQFPALTAKYWVEEIRELSYDIDDFLDELVHAIAAHQRLRGRIARFRERRSRSRWAAKEIAGLLARLEEAVQRYVSYNLNKLKLKPAPAGKGVQGPPLPPLYGVETAAGRLLVGVESSLAKLEGWLAMDQGEGHGLPRPRVVSILGFAGVGKTTLANELYRRLGTKFDCRAFVRSSRKPNIGKLLTSILLQVRRRRYLDASDQPSNLASIIRAHLQDKTYLIVIDDLWDSSTWDIIDHALPDDNLFSKIITTTELEVVAHRCCGHNSEHIFKMDTLSNVDASKLFSSIVDRSQPSISRSLIDDSTEDLSIKEKIRSEIVSKCGGFPLVTIATASLLAKKQEMEQWHSLWSSLSSNLEINANVEGIKQVLCLCFDNLPEHLKTCMLYCSLYPEDEIIQKHDLVNLWTIEGFICVKEGKDIKEVAYTYFDELLSWGMIQPAYIKRNGEVLSCTVHYLILELIQYKSIKENFVTTVHHSESNIRIADKVRRLSLCFGEAGDAKRPEKLRLSQIRSLFFFGLMKSLPTSAEFRLLRLLILHLWADQDNISLDLNTVSKLFSLRYFTIACNATLNLQGQLQGLQYLDTLKIEARVSEVPQGIVNLPRLLHLSLPGDRIPDEIGCMVSLETLGCYDLSSNSAGSVLSLGKLTNLQDLGLTCSTIPCDSLEEKVGCLASSLSGLSNLKCLAISPAVGSCNVDSLEGIASSTDTSYDRLSTVSSPPALLEKMELSPKVCIFSRLPRWIPELGKLTILKISALELSQRDIDTLRKLNSLAALSLYVRNNPSKRILFDENGFNVLRDFKFICPALCPAFVKGAIPKVRTLKLGFCARTLQECIPVDAGFEHLKGCAVFSAKIGYAGADECVRKIVHSALEDIFGMGGSHPVINVHLVDKTFFVIGESSTVAQGEPPHTQEKDIGSIFRGKSSTENKNTQDHSWITTPPQDSSLQISSSCAVDTQNPGNNPLMESAMVSISTGAMNSILVKLGSLNLHLYEELRSKGEQGLTLESELQAMNGDLKKFSNTADPDVMKLRNQMRELTYDIEDSIDNLVTNFFDEKGRGFPQKMVMPYDFVDQIRKLRAQVKYSKLQSTFPNIAMHTLGQSYAPREHWLSRIDDDGNGLVGMERQQDELVSKLTYVTQNKLQWVCIVGDTGIGKTMLAKQVYNEIKGRFSTSVFISVPKKLYSYNNIGGMVSWLYTAILAKLRGTNIEETNSDDVISEVKRLLQAKRFLMVIDGVSSDEILHSINLALPQNSTGSGIIITTGSGDEVELVGTYSSSFVHPMMPLTFKESLCLFVSIIFGSARSCPIGLEKDFEEIVNACRGIPMAIRVIAGALSSKPAEMEHRRSTYSKIIEAIDHQNAEWIQEILGICYSDLSCDMKTCLLYLCSFPENHVVRMDRLIRRWVSEGFVTQKSEETWREAGEGYCLELISRKLIEPVYDNKDVLPTGYTICGSVYHFITSQSSEENFIKSDVPNETHHGSDNNKVKRLALVQGTLGSKVRSLTFVCDYIGTVVMMPHLSVFRHLRVLDLGDTKGIEIKQPETIGGLSLLRYLGLGGTDVTRLPKEITALEHLSTLDLRRTRVKHVPEFKGQKMISLLGDQLIFERGRGQLDGMQKLEELSKVLVGPDGSAADYLAKLVNEIRRLRMLGVTFSRLFDDKSVMRCNRNRVKHFLEELFKSKLQSLMLDNCRESLLDILFETWANKTPPYLRKIELRIRGCLPVDPAKMASLIALTHLNIEVTQAEAQGVSALGMLPQLVLLNLYIDTSTTTRFTMSSSDGFQCLKVLGYRCRCDAGMGLQFGAGAMPQLQRLWLDINVRETMSKYGDFCFGIEHLSRLVQVCATIDCKDTLTAPLVEQAEANIRAQVSRNPNNPVLELNRRGHDHLTPQQGQFFIMEAPKVIEIHSHEEWFSQIEYTNSRNKLVLIKFTASWCRPSRQIAPFFSYLSKTNPNVIFLKVDVDEMEDIATAFNVKAMPTFLFMTGGDVKDKVLGAYPEELLEKLKKLQMTQSSDEDSGGATRAPAPPTAMTPMEPGLSPPYHHEKEEEGKVGLEEEEEQTSPASCYSWLRR